MIATKEATIREHVIALLRADGHSPIQSVELWDRVYSRQYESAKPGVKVTWVIGRYEFEFIKQATNPLDLIAQASPEAADLNVQSQGRGWLQALALVVGVIAALIYFL